MAKTDWQSITVITTLFCLLMITNFDSRSQNKSVINVFAKKQKGIGFVTTDSSFSLNFQFRIQNRALYTSKSDTDMAPESFELRVRRMRMKFTGFVLNPKFTYYFQLGFTRGDMDWRGPDNNKVNNSPNIIRDAVIYYNPTSKLKLGFGQTKIPGNRQRVVSSGDQQFYDRSIVNARFTLDRDFGIFGHYTTPYVILRGSITSGEGRNADISNNGLAYTGRMELLPFGKFKGENDYQEGDLDREEKIKVSLAATFSVNDRALRNQGQLGNDLFTARTMKSMEFDVLVKYNGWAWYTEFMNRSSNNPVTSNPANASQVIVLYAGEGKMSQLSYIFKNNFEIAGRYATTKPSSKLYNNPEAPLLNEKQVENYEIGVSRYYYGHRVKIQGGVVYSKLTDLRTKSFQSANWSTVVQLELGI